MLVALAISHLLMPVAPLLQIQNEENLKMSFNKINKLKKKTLALFNFCGS
jgi:hypothetical protein